MWNDQKRERLQQLRRSELAAVLTDSEKSELQTLIHELENDEAVLLGAATEKLRNERQAMEVQNRILQDLLGRRQALAARVRIVLAESQSEREAIDRELSSALSGTNVALGS